MDTSVRLVAAHKGMGLRHFPAEEQTCATSVCGIPCPPARLRLPDLIVTRGSLHGARKLLAFVGATTRAPCAFFQIAQDSFAVATLCAQGRASGGRAASQGSAFRRLFPGFISFWLRVDTNSVERQRNGVPGSVSCRKFDVSPSEAPGAIAGEESRILPLFLEFAPRAPLLFPRIEGATPLRLTHVREPPGRRAYMGIDRVGFLCGKPRRRAALLPLAGRRGRPSGEGRGSEFGVLGAPRISRRNGAGDRCGSIYERFGRCFVVLDVHRRAPPRGGEAASPLPTGGRRTGSRSRFPLSAGWCTGPSRSRFLPMPAYCLPATASIPCPTPPNLSRCSCVRRPHALPRGGDRECCARPAVCPVARSRILRNKPARECLLPVYSLAVRQEAEDWGGAAGSAGERARAAVGGEGEAEGRGALSASWRGCICGLAGGGALARKGRAFALRRRPTPSALPHHYRASGRRVPAR